MGKLIKVEPLGKVVESLLPIQREYLFLRLMGLNSSGSLQIINRKYKTIEKWKDDKFGEIEEYVLSHSDVYSKEAGHEFFINLDAKFTFGLDVLADKLLDWDTLDPTDKRHVMDAMRIWKGIKFGVASGESYEERIKRLRQG